MGLDKKCGFCDKRGLPLVLVRNAIVQADSGAPRASGLAIELPQSIAYYTKRLLRSGYINLFDEARRRWETYFVTADGYYAKLLQTTSVNPVVPQKPFNCPDEGHRALASCITISDPKNASKVWIGFSDVLWTDSVRKANEDPGYRQRHMTEIDVRGALKGSSRPHQPIADLTHTVAEYALTASVRKINIGWSPFQFNERHDISDRLKRECELLRPGCSLIVTLSDPAGMAQELAALMKVQAQRFIDKVPGDKRKLAASAAIDQIREGICGEAERNEILAAESLASKQMDENPLGHLISDAVRRKSEQINLLRSSDLRRSADKAWEKYKNKYNNEAREFWLKDFHCRFSAFDRGAIAPIALSHVQWMRSKEMLSYFECNYDPQNAESGAVYTQVITNCVANTQDKKVCANLYEEWLKGDIEERSNLLLRAFVLNQETTIKAIKSAAEVNIGFGQIPWDAIFEVHNHAIERLSAAAQDVTAQLIAQLGGPLVKAVNKIMDGNAAFRALFMSLGVVARQPIIILDIVDSAKNFEKYLVKTIIEQHGRPLNKGRLEGLVKNELRRRQIHGMQLQQNNKRKWVVTIDLETIKKIPTNLKTKQVEKFALRGIKTVDEIEVMNLNRWRSVINTNVRQGVVAAILQTASLLKLQSDEEDSLENEKQDATLRRQAGMTTLCATVAEALGNMLEARAGQGMKFGQGVAAVGSFIKKHAARAGVLAGLVMAGLDFFKAYKEYKEGAGYLVAGAYIGSGLVSILLTIALFSAWAVPVIGLLLLLLIGIGILIEYIKDNPIQDWLERCQWGKLEAQRYPDLATEQAQLKLAFG